MRSKAAARHAYLIDIVGVPRLNSRQCSHRILQHPIERDLTDEDLADQGFFDANRAVPGICVRLAFALGVASCFDLREKVRVWRELRLPCHELNPALEVAVGPTLIQTRHHGEQLGARQVKLKQGSGRHGLGGRKQRPGAGRGRIGIELSPGAEDGGQP